MKDVVIYAIDFLPEIVTIEYKGKKYAFKFNLWLNGSKGLKLVYDFDEAYSSEGIDLYDDKTPKIISKFAGVKGGGGQTFLYMAEYIRSQEELSIATEDAYEFLRSRNYCEERQYDIENDERLFNVNTFLGN